MSDSDRQEFWACLCLKHAPGLGPRTSKRILERFGSAAKAVVRAKSWLDMGLVTSQQLQAFLAESWRPHAEAELCKAEDKGIPALVWSDPRYPQHLREIPDPPVFLYAVGDIGLLDNPGVAMVGSRDCSRYGIELAHRIAMELSGKGLTVISGLAYGIDREAHLGGLTGPGSTIAVMGTGPDLVYPATNRDLWREMAEKGLILSEFTPGTKPHAGNFPLRNRIISGLSLGVLVAEASTRSGSLITARLAMEQGREVFAVPGPVSLKSYRGCHEIINKGAKLVHGSEDILMELKPQLEAFLAGQGLPKAPPKARQYPEQARLVPDRPAPAAPARRTARPKPPQYSPAQDAHPDDSRLAPPAKPKRDSKGRGPLAAGGVSHDPSPRRGTHSPLTQEQSTAEGIPYDSSPDLPPAPKARPSGRVLKSHLAAVPDSPAPAASPAVPGGAAFPLEENVAGHLAAMGATHIDSLCRVFGRDASEMSRTLVVLELKGVVRRLPGGYYLTA